MNRYAHVGTCCAIALTAITSGLPADAPQTYQLPSSAQVIGYVLESVNWYRHVYAERQVANEPADLAFRDENRAMELQIVKLSFEFARADAVLVTTGPAPPGDPALSDPPTPDLAHFVEMKNRNDRENHKAVQEIETLNEQISRAKKSERLQLQLALDEAEGRLQLLEAFSQTISDLIEFVKNAHAGQTRAGTLDSRIDGLARLIPEMDGPPVLSTTSAFEAATSKSAVGDTGILGLVSDDSVTNRKLHLVDEKIRLTNNLTLSAESLRTPTADFATRLMQSVAGIDVQASDLPSLREQKSRLDALTLELKGLSPVIVALDKQKVLLAQYKSNLLRLRTEAAGQYRRARERLMTRLLVVALIIGSIIAIGHVSRRLALRRVQDPNRKRLIAMIHRFLTLFAIAAVLLFVLASDLKSVATYLGLLSAALLLALQNVILASLGALLLVGKRGIRIGDRVQVSNITGDVIDIGLLQFQLREFDLAKGRFTGHVATFSNSLVFVSPSTGVVRFDSAAERASQAETGTGRAAPETAEHVPAAEG